MAVRKEIQIGDPILRLGNREVTDIKTPKIRQIIKDLKDTMLERDMIGLSAPQIAENYKIFVTEPRKTKARNIGEDKFRVYINPKIVDSSEKEVIIFEGCGSVLSGQLFGPVRRPKEITIEATDQNDKKFRLRCDGVLARVIQHEYDHLLGVTFLEKISDYSQTMTVEHYRKRIRNSEQQVELCQISILELTYV